MVAAGSIGRASEFSGADTFAAALVPIVRTLQSTGASTLEALTRGLNKRGVRTARGARWHVLPVANLLSARRALQKLARFRSLLHRREIWTARRLRPNYGTKSRRASRPTCIARSSPAGTGTWIAVPTELAIVTKKPDRMSHPQAAALARSPGSSPRSAPSRRRSGREEGERCRPRQSREPGGGRLYWPCISKFRRGRLRSGSGPDCANVAEYRCQHIGSTHPRPERARSALPEARAGTSHRWPICFPARRAL